VGRNAERLNIEVLLADDACTCRLRSVSRILLLHLSVYACLCLRVRACVSLCLSGCLFNRSADCHHLGSITPPQLGPHCGLIGNCQQMRLYGRPGNGDITPCGVGTYSPATIWLLHSWCSTVVCLPKLNRAILNQRRYWLPSNVDLTFLICTLITIHCNSTTSSHQLH